MDVEDFLSRPLVARIAANGSNGPTIRPVWFLYEEGSFWWLTGSSYSKLGELLAEDPRVAIAIDTCDLETGEVFAVTATGRAFVHPLDAALAKRKLSKYLGPDFDRWDDRFRGAFEDPTTRLVSLRPDHPPKLRDMSFVPSQVAG
jgi:nitroimidazol reductase NimA-like FMN-containing flavoprotein (pyridoxamine 5'-phosphate oxidase superfamily)